MYPTPKLLRHDVVVSGGFRFFAAFVRGPPDVTLTGTVQMPDAREETIPSTPPSVPIVVVSSLVAVSQQKSLSVSMNFTTSTTTDNHWKGYGEGQQQNNKQGLAPRRRMNQGDTQLQGGMNSPTYSDEEHGIMMTTTTGNTPYDINDDDNEPPALLMVAPTDSHIRSLLKGVTWRCLATATTVTIAWFVTGEVGQALRIGFVEFFAKLAIYYAHERIWAKIRTV